MGSITGIIIAGRVAGQLNGFWEESRSSRCLSGPFANESASMGMWLGQSVAGSGGGTEYNMTCKDHGCDTVLVFSGLD